jgi:hypothetical protein
MSALSICAAVSVRLIYQTEDFVQITFNFARNLTYTCCLAFTKQDRGNLKPLYKNNYLTPGYVSAVISSLVTLVINGQGQKLQAQSHCVITIHRKLFSCIRFLTTTRILNKIKMYNFHRVLSICSKIIIIIISLQPQRIRLTENKLHYQKLCGIFFPSSVKIIFSSEETRC